LISKHPALISASATPLLTKKFPKISTRHKKLAQLSFIMNNLLISKLPLWQRKAAVAAVAVCYKTKPPLFLGNKNN